MSRCGDAFSAPEKELSAHLPSRHLETQINADLPLIIANRSV
jgi:hypothetical protein